MAQDEGFLRAIIEEPDDVALRLIYADWLDERGDPRGEFIRVQCELARMSGDNPRRVGLEAREQELLKQNEQAWAGPLPCPARTLQFRRGFPADLDLSLTDLGDAGAKALAASGHW